MGNCEDCKKIKDCKKFIGIVWGFCNTDFEPNDADDKKEGEWIPCSERLPEKDGECLVQRSGDLCVDMCVAYFNHHGGNYWVDNDGFILKGICAWMPLPKPYEKEGE